MPAHVRRLVDHERLPRASALQARERAGRARVEDGDPHVGRDLIEPIAQRLVRVAIVAEQQPLLVGVPRVVDDDLDAATVRAPGTSCARVTRRAEEIESLPESSRSLGCFQQDLIRRRHPAKSTSTRAKRSASATAYSQQLRDRRRPSSRRRPAHSCSGPAALEPGEGGPAAPNAGDGSAARAINSAETQVRRIIGVPLSAARKSTARARAAARARAGARRGVDARRRAQRPLSVGTANGASPVIEIKPLPPRRVVQFVALVEQHCRVRVGSAAACSPFGGKCSVTAPRPSIDRITPYGSAGRVVSEANHVPGVCDRAVGERFTPVGGLRDRR